MSRQRAAGQLVTRFRRDRHAAQARQDAFSTGDLAAARLLLRRAAEAGSAEAALALGATFDPLVIRRLGAIGAAPDAAQARKWY